MTERVRGDELAAQGAREGHSVCWSCRHDVGGDPLCPHCVKIQPLGRNSDFFAVMGLPRKLGIDPRVLEPVFHALSRRFHPDMYRMAPVRERIIALENSALLNQAYRTLRDPFERAGYLVQLEEGRAAPAKDAPPQELFEEILEVQELLADHALAEEEERAPLRERLADRREALRGEQDSRAARLTDALFPAWDALQDSPEPAPADRKAPLLAEMRRLLGERAYLKRVLGSLDEALKVPNPTPYTLTPKP
jgi:molecular chaperone HscB